MLDEARADNREDDLEHLKPSSTSPRSGAHVTTYSNSFFFFPAE